MQHWCVTWCHLVCIQMTSLHQEMPRILGFFMVSLWILGFFYVSFCLFNSFTIAIEKTIRVTGYCDLVYFTIRVPETGYTKETRVRQEQHKCNTSEKKLFLYFYTPIWAIWQMKDYKESNSFILLNSFEKYPVPILKLVSKVHHKNWTRSKSKGQNCSYKCPCTFPHGYA